MSGTVIDSLVISLSLDTDKFTDDQRKAINALRGFQDAAHRGANEAESNTKKMGNAISDLKREALGLVSVFLGGRGVKEFFGYVTNLDAATGRLSKTMATNVEEVSAWQGAVKQAGGTAEGASSALAGLSGEMSTFQLTGQSAMLPVLSRLGLSLYDQQGKLKTSTQLWLELADSVKGMDPRQAQAFLQMIPGANQDMINFALLGRKAMEGYLRDSRSAGITTREAAAAAIEYERNISLLEQSATGLGRTLVNLLTPALSKTANSMSKLFSAWQVDPKSPEGVENAPKSRDNLVKRFGSPRKFVNDLGEFFGMGKGVGDRAYGPEGNDEKDTARAVLSAKMRADAMRKAATAADPTSSGARMPGYETSATEVERMIRAAAIKRGIDPETAMSVAKSEGFFNYKSTVPGEDSTGPFQLYHGAKGGGGLGTAFKKQTGLDAHDPSTVPQQIDFALDYAKSNGWGAWYGWKGLPYAGIGGPRPGAGAAARGMPGSSGPAGNTSSATVTIGTVQVNAPNAKDATGIAQEIEPALSRAVTAGAANFGQN